MRFELSDIERVILINQYKILAILHPQDSYGRLLEALKCGYVDEYSKSMGEELYSTKDEDRQFVSRVLKMFLDFAEAREDGLARADELPKYLGFDSNNEGRLGSYADFLLAREGHYRALKPAPTNSHMPTRDTYKLMLDLWTDSKTTIEVRPEHIALFLSKLSPHSEREKG